MTEQEDTENRIRIKLYTQLAGSGLLEYGCRNDACNNQIFATWEIDVTCNACEQRLVSRYELDR